MITMTTMTTFQPLNPGLFKALQARFGTVKLANEGQRIQFSKARVLSMNNRVVETIISQGEQYRVCCPYCADTRYRLYVSYLWNTPGEDGRKIGKFKLFCHNENCPMENFEEELKLYMLDSRVTAPQAGEFKTLTPLAPVALPGACVSLRDLDLKHPAIEYVRQRKFDPLELADKWGVCYCLSAAEDERGFIPGTNIYARLVVNRLVVPIRWEEKLVGWQARSIATDSRGQIKYYTMPGLSKTSLLFNGDRARKFKFGVIVEGVFDAFRVGERAVALLGKTISLVQIQLLYAYWGSGGCCLMLDEDAKYPAKPGQISSVDRNTQLINASGFAKGFFNVSPPVGEDPGSMTFDDIWSLVSSYARTRGFEIA